MTTKTISFRLPGELIEAIDARVKATGRTRTSLVVESLSEAFGLPRLPPESSLQDRVAALEDRVAVLEQAMEENQ